MAKSNGDDRVNRMNVYDCAALFSLGDSLKDDQGRPAKMNYAEAKELSAKAREEFKLDLAQLDLAFVSIDLHSEAQRRFLDALRGMGIEQEAIDFRHAFVSAVAPSDRGERSPVSLSTHIAYLLGLLAERGNAEVVVWSGSFDLYYPLKDFVEVRKGKAVLAYFRRSLDPRWAHAGLFEKNSPIKFFDLEDHSETLLGIDLERIEATASRNIGGLRRV